MLFEVYIVRLQHDPPKSSANSSALDGISGASLELVCHCRLHGDVESAAVLSIGGGDASKRRDSIILTFEDATLKQHSLIRSAVNLPHDAYKLLAVPSPIGGVLVIGANTIHYHSQSASCALALNSYAVSLDNSQELPRSSFNVELDAANATWLLNDVAWLSAKNGELLLLTLIYDGRVVQRLDLSKSKASVLSSGITTIGSSMFSSRQPVRRQYAGAILMWIGCFNALIQSKRRFC